MMKIGAQSIVARGWDEMRFIFRTRFLSGILILLLGISGIWTGKDQENACLSFEKSISFAQEGHSQARIDHGMQSPQRDVARIEETGIRSFQHILRISRGSYGDQGKGNFPFLSGLAGQALSFYRHQINRSLKYCLFHCPKGAGWQTIISFIHQKDGAKG